MRSTAPKPDPLNEPQPSTTPANMNFDKLTGKVAVVTGASKGIGAAIARHNEPNLNH